MRCLIRYRMRYRILIDIVCDIAYDIAYFELSTMGPDAISHVISHAISQFFAISHAISHIFLFYRICPSGGSLRANRPNHSFGSARFGRFTSPIHLGGGFPNPEQTKFGPEQTFFVADQTKTKPKSVLPKPHANLFFKIPNHEKTLFEVCRFRVKPKPNLSSLLDPILHRV